MQHTSLEGKGFNEVGLSGKDDLLFRVDKEFFRPLESDNYEASYLKAKRELGWEPPTKFKHLVDKMVNHDINEIAD